VAVVLAAPDCAYTNTRLHTLQPLHTKRAATAHKTPPHHRPAPPAAPSVTPARRVAAAHLETRRRHCTPVFTGATRTLALSPRGLTLVLDNPTWEGSAKGGPWGLVPGSLFLVPAAEKAILQNKLP
jgi:hypothetical protein